MRNSTLIRASELRQKNTSNMSDLTVQESSNYRMRFTPLSSPSARNRGTIIIKSHETIVLNMLSSTNRQFEQSYKLCQECNSEFGQVKQYCKCKGITYHEKCLLDTTKKNVIKLKEQAFICKYDCAYPFQIEGYYMKDITKNGKYLIAIIIILILIFILIILAIFILWNHLNSSQIISIFIIQIILLITLTFILRKLKLNYYKLYWHIRPYLINERIIKHKSIKLYQLLPFIINQRDVIVYTQDNQDQIIEQ